MLNTMIAEAPTLQFAVAVMRYYRAVICCVLLVLSKCETQEQANLPAVSPMQKQEREALYSAIQGFVGERWNGFEVYPDPCGWTPIQGVQCDIKDGYWYVTSMTIGSVFEYSLQCGDNAKFSALIFELKHLKTLSLVKCFNSIEMPATLPSIEWQTFSDNLENLEFRSNPGLVGNIPAAIGLLARLQSLVLLENGLSGRVPTELGNLTKLKRLVLAGNRLRGDIPPSIGRLSDLLILDVSRNLLSGPIPSTFGGLTSALKLDLSGNKLEGNTPNVWQSLNNLGLLDVGDNNLTGGLVKSFEQMVSLNGLRVSNNPMIGGELTGINWEVLQNVELLDVSNCGLRGGLPESIAKMRRLRYLDLSNNYLSGGVSKAFQEISTLGSLFLDGNDLSGRLEFTGTFYQNMGHRLGLSNNARLCYSKDNVSPTQAPSGISLCKQPLFS